MSGQSICEPVPMPYASLHEVFACCATPSVMWKPVTITCEKGTSVAESLSNAFDDQVSLHFKYVCISFVYNFI